MIINSRGVSSMVVLILAVLLILILWETSQFFQTWSEAGIRPAPKPITAPLDCPTGDPLDCFDKRNCTTTECR